MTPQHIAQIRQQVSSLEAQANEIEPDSPKQAEQLKGMAEQLYAVAILYCWGCGQLLSAVDHADHFCNACLPPSADLSFPD